MSGLVWVVLATGLLAAAAAGIALAAMQRALGAERSAQWARRHARAARDRARVYAVEALAARQTASTHKADLRGDLDVTAERIRSLRDGLDTLADARIERAARLAPDGAAVADQLAWRPASPPDQAGDVLGALEVALRTARDDEQPFDDEQAMFVRRDMAVVLAAMTRWIEPRSPWLATTLTAGLGEVVDVLARPRSAPLDVLDVLAESKDRVRESADGLVDLPPDAVEVRGAAAELSLGGLPGGHRGPDLALHVADAHESSPSVGRSPVGAGPVGGAPGVDAPGADDPTVGAPTDATGAVSAPPVSVEGPAGDGEATAPSPAEAPIPDDVLAAWVCPCGASGYLAPGGDESDRRRYEEALAAHEETCPDDSTGFGPAAPGVTR